jgi:uncharacterized protein YvpB
MLDPKKRGSREEYLKRAALIKASLRVRLRSSLSSQESEIDTNFNATSGSAKQVNKDDKNEEKKSDEALNRLKQEAEKINQKVKQTFQIPDLERNNYLQQSKKQNNQTTTAVMGINPNQFEEKKPEINTYASNNYEKLKKIKTEIFQQSFQNNPKVSLSEKLEKLKNQVFQPQKPQQEINRFNFQAQEYGNISNHNFFQTPNNNNANIQSQNFVNSFNLKYDNRSYQPYQPEKFQESNTLKYPENLPKRLPTKKYQIKRPYRQFDLNLDNNTKLLLTNIVSYSLILFVLIGGFYLTFSSGTNSTNTAQSQVLGTNENSQKTEIPKTPEPEIISDILPKKQILEIETIQPEYKLSSQAASLAMALSYFKIEVSQDEILDRIGFSRPIQPERIGKEIIWGNPDEGFLGYVNGFFGSGEDKTIESSTGWGVNSDPVLKVAKEYLKNSEKLKEGSISEIKKNLAEKKPIIIWHQFKNSSEETLTIKTNQNKKFELKEHTVSLLIGYEEKDGETIYFLNNPEKGQMQIKQNDLINQWSKMNRQAIVITK